MKDLINIESFNEETLAKTEQLIKSSYEAIENLAQQSFEPSWENLCLVLETIEDEVNKAFKPLEHLNNVVPGKYFKPELFNNLSKIVCGFKTTVQQQPQIYQQLFKLKASPIFSSLKPYQQKVINNRINQAELLGAKLSEADRNQFKALKKDLSELGLQFKENLNKSRKACKIHVEDECLFKGLPEEVIASAQNNAKKENKQGWIFDASVFGYIKLCESRQFREKIYKLEMLLASEDGPGGEICNNGPVVEKLIEIRYKIAQLLGFPHYGAFSASQKMLNLKQIEKLLIDLQNAFKQKRNNLLDELQQFAKEKYSISTIEGWDEAYVFRKMTEGRFNLDMTEIDKYYTLEQVMSGTFDILQKVYDIRIESKKLDNAWDEDVYQFDLYNSDNQLLGNILADLFIRDNKRPSAWTWNWQYRFEEGKDVLQKPIGCLSTDFTKPQPGKITQLSFAEATIFVHELGHALHMTLNQAKVPSVCPLDGIPWDGIEVPSTFMEFWLLDSECSKILSKNSETGLSISSEQLNKLRSSNELNEFSQWARVLALSVLDFKLYTNEKPLDLNTANQLLSDTYHEIALTKSAQVERFLHRFTHLGNVEYNDGYVLGYYSYLLSKVMSSQIMQQFNTHGGLNPEDGKRYLQTIIEPGGSTDFYELFQSFVGESININPFLKDIDCVEPPKINPQQFFSALEQPMNNIIAPNPSARLLGSKF